MSTRASAAVSLLMVTLFGVAGASAPVAPVRLPDVATARGQTTLSPDHLVLVESAATEAGGDAYSEIVPLRTVPTQRREGHAPGVIRAAMSARGPMSPQWAMAATGYRSHPPTAPPSRSR